MADRITDSPARCGLGLFAKNWIPGTVKTRLAKTLGNQLAAEIYLHLLDHHLNRFRAVADNRTVVFAPDDPATKARFESTVDTRAWDLVPQAKGDLGYRMHSFFRQQLAGPTAPISKSVIVGSDAPQLSEELVVEAFELLETHDVVFGPSTDGGYYLIGLRAEAPELFRDIAWSTDRVLQQSLEKCRKFSLSVGQLPPLTDIDEERDLQLVLELMSREADESGRILQHTIQALLAGTGR